MYIVELDSYTTLCFFFTANKLHFSIINLINDTTLKINIARIFLR